MKTSFVSIYLKVVKWIKLSIEFYGVVFFSPTIRKKGEKFVYMFYIWNIDMRDTRDGENMVFLFQ